MKSEENSSNEIQKNSAAQAGGKQKDYKKLSTVKSIIFLILAVVILGGIYLNEKRPFSAAQETESAAPVIGTLPAEE